MAEPQEQKEEMATEDGLCFIVMPIGDPEGYVKGHFKRVYQDIIQPACRQAGFSPLRADEVKQTNLIHLDILQKLLEAPMAICDLSAGNPNVLFELALRQAFDKPVTLVQEVGSPQIFDISPLRYTEYRKERVYHEVLEDQKAIAAAVKETFESHSEGRGINSIVKLLSLNRHAILQDIATQDAKADLQQLILAELGQLREELRIVRRDAYTAARPLDRQLRPLSERLNDGIIDAEMRLSLTSSEPELEYIEKIIGDCRLIVTYIGNHLSNTPSVVPVGSVENLEDISRRIEKLQIEVRKRRETLAKK